MSRTERKLRQAVAEIEELRRGIPNMQFAMKTQDAEIRALRNVLRDLPHPLEVLLAIAQSSPSEIARVSSEPLCPLSAREIEMTLKLVKDALANPFLGDALPDGSP